MKLPRQEGRHTSTSLSHALTCPTRMRSLFLGPMREHVCEPGTVTSNPDGSVYTRWLQVLCCNVGYEPWDTRERAGRGVSSENSYIVLSRNRCPLARVRFYLE